MTMDFSVLTIEILMAVLGLALLVFGLLVPHQDRRGIGYFTTAALAGILLLTLILKETPGSFLEGMYLADPYAYYFKVLFLAAAILVSFASHSYIEKGGYNQAEYYSLLVFATLGMMILAGAGDLITLYLGLELMSISFVVLVAFKLRDAKSAEGGLKYVLLTAMSSAVLLYGLSLVFGVTGTTILKDIAAVLVQGDMPPIMLVGLVFLLAGFGFKISAVPFHMWAPDIYEGAPTPVTAFLASGSKAAAFAALLRVFLTAVPSMSEIWVTILVALTVLTLLLGNLVAIPQTNIKRMLAYSSISQAGYILLGVIAASASGVGSVLYYAMVYVFATMAAFLVVTAVGEELGSEEITAFTGLAQRAPFMAWTLLFSMLSMAGIPFLAGFFGKVLLFKAVMEQGYMWLALLAVLMSMVSVYYYLQVVKVMFIGEPEPGAEPIKTSLSFQVALLISFAGIVGLGIYPAPLYDWSVTVAQSFMGLL